MATRAWSGTELEKRLRAVGAEEYYHRHPFHQLLHGGRLDLFQVQAWALNRAYYQSQIPVKDATLIARSEDPEFRRAWRRRLADHDGDLGEIGGYERWLALTDGLDLDRDLVTSAGAILPATRFAVDAYVRFVRERPLVEAVASSLTELFAPEIISERVSGMLAHYAFVPPESLAYFEFRPPQARRDAAFALAYVKRQAKTRKCQDAVIAALRFKCGVLWAMLDALHHAYVIPGHVPPGAFKPSLHP